MYRRMQMKAIVEEYVCVLVKIIVIAITDASCLPSDLDATTCLQVVGYVYKLQYHTHDQRKTMQLLS